jgi:hypothetical protein
MPCDSMTEYQSLACHNNSLRLEKIIEAKNLGYPLIGIKTRKIQNGIFLMWVAARNPRTRYPFQNQMEKMKGMN